MEIDLVIANGTIIDGTGRPRFRADVGIRDGRISAIATDGPLSGRQTLDASGMAVSPGFIDVHSHSDWILPQADHEEVLAPLVLQGVTTIVTGQCGYSPAPVTAESAPLVGWFSETLRDKAYAFDWFSMDDFLGILEREGVLLNTATVLGHGTIRYAVMGERTGPPTVQDLDGMGELTRRAIREGAFGLSAGLAYAPGVFARSDELLPLLRVAAQEGACLPFTVGPTAGSLPCTSR